MVPGVDLSTATASEWVRPSVLCPFSPRIWSPTYGQKHSDNEPNNLLHLMIKHIILFHILLIS